MLSMKRTLALFSASRTAGTKSLKARVFETSNSIPASSNIGLTQLLPFSVSIINAGRSEPGILRSRKSFTSPIATMVAVCVLPLPASPINPALKNAIVFSAGLNSYSFHSSRFLRQQPFNHLDHGRLG
jgi:hypothetical protein